MFILKSGLCQPPTNAAMIHWHPPLSCHSAPSGTRAAGKAIVPLSTMMRRAVEQKESCTTIQELRWT